MNWCVDQLRCSKRGAGQISRASGQGPAAVAVFSRGQFGGEKLSETINGNQVQRGVHHEK